MKEAQVRISRGGEMVAKGEGEENRQSAFFLNIRCITINPKQPHLAKLNCIQLFSQITMAARVVKLIPGKTAFLFCDIQTKFRASPIPLVMVPLTHHFDSQKRLFTDTTPWLPLATNSSNLPRCAWSLHSLPARRIQSTSIYPAPRGPRNCHRAKSPRQVMLPSGTINVP